MTAATKEVFLSHAGEDKDAYVLPLMRTLEDVGVSCWLDAVEIRWGESIVRKINEGLSTSKYVVVVLSDAFFSKPWAMRELEGALHVELATDTLRVLPIVVGDAHARVLQLPLLAPKRFLRWEDGPGPIAAEILGALGREYREAWTHSHPADYSGPVWVTVSPLPARSRAPHKVALRWGRWAYHAEVEFRGGTVALCHTKGGDGLSIPLHARVEPPCFVAFGAGEPPASERIDANSGWRHDLWPFR